VYGIIDRPVWLLWLVAVCIAYIVAKREGFKQ
jgi:hypothetical protein